jgi:predicted nucleic acid-binding protein
MFVLDTNVVSELRKVRLGKADARVASWAESVDAADLYLSVITVQELEIGVLLAERRDPAQGTVFRAWLDSHVIPAFAGRILPIDMAVAQRSAKLHVPDPRPARDGLIAATALVHGMTIITRNLGDFESSEVRLLNPWTWKIEDE